MTASPVATTGNSIDADGVDHPIHYNAHPSGVECIELIRGLNFDIGNAVKYVFRAGLKDDPIRDLRKAWWYISDYLFDASGERRTEKAPFGEIRSAWSWDQVVVHEPDVAYRLFYLRVMRGDVTGARQALDSIIRQNGGHGDD